MSYHKILSALLCEEWQVRPSWQSQAIQAVKVHLEGGGSPPFAAPKQDRSEESKCGVTFSGDYALLKVEGVIGRHLSLLEMVCSEGYDLARLEKQIEEIEAREHITTVILWFNSPGGRATWVHEAATLVRNLAESRRVIAWIDSECCSAAYYIAAGCTAIYGPETAVVGSISTIIALIDDSERWKKEGLKLELFTDGTLKAAGIRGASLTDAQRKFFETRRDECGARFKMFVIECRPQIEREALEGGWYSCATGKVLGLVDDCIPTMQALIERLESERAD
ncbi:MAG: S49 family peptidase [Verrucomicrobiales bacterium]